MDFKAKMNENIEEVNKALEEYVTEKDTPEATVYKAMRYSLMAGGKRLRPVLALAVTEMLGGRQKDIMPYACALELIHTYSLIHDDLPAMDNDDYRRGRLTCHKVYGDAMAVLAGDALLNRAFEIMLEDMAKTQEPGEAKRKILAANAIGKASGAMGMIGGQVVDLEAEGKQIEKELLFYMHRNKTGALIKAPVLAAAYVCGAAAETMEQLGSFADMLGLAFQIKDDILDVEGDPEVMGKAAGSDQANNKTTYITVFGLEGSKRKLAETTEAAYKSLSIFGNRAEFLLSLTDYLSSRNK